MQYWSTPSTEKNPLHGVERPVLSWQRIPSLPQRIHYMELKVTSMGVSSTSMLELKNPLHGVESGNIGGDTVTFNGCPESITWS